MTTLTQTALADTAFAKLEAERRLQNPVFKDATKKPGRFGFRGEIAIKFAAQVADEARPPETTCDQVMTIANEGEKGIPFFAGYLLSFGYLDLLVEALGDTLQASGKDRTQEVRHRHQAGCRGRQGAHILGQLSGDHL
jgi:hypothetical protein